MNIHRNLLSELNQNLPLSGKLKIIHTALKARLEFVDRISVALYDSKLSTLKTFLSSSGRDYPLEFYEVRIEEAPSLVEIMKSGNPRVVNDLSIFSKGDHEHTRKILDQGYRSSYTTPLYFNRTFSGFIFFNSYTADCFDDSSLDELDVYSQLISFMVAQEILGAKAIVLALLARGPSGKDEPMYVHRISRFSRLIARELAKQGKYPFSDEEIEQISLFSPVHTMKGLPQENFEQIQSVLMEFELQPLKSLDLLQNIALFHGERMDGSGQNWGLKGKDIPIEARIVAVAEIFDAMTNSQSFRHAWSNEEVFATLQRLSKNQVDADCVEALMRRRDSVEEIQAELIDL